MLQVERSRVALVTGANKGIGFHITRQVAQAGLVAVMGCRDGTRAVSAVHRLRSEGLEVESVQLDVTDDRSLQAAMGSIRERHGRLDVLFNNAGITSGLASASEVTRDELWRTFDTNVFGLVAVTNASLPLLRDAEHGRIVNLSSELGSPRFMSAPDGPFAGLNNAAYQASKSAVDLITVLYANELAGTGIAVNAVGPGYRATELSGRPTPGAGDPAEGAAVAVAVALDPDDSNTGRFVNQHRAVVPW